MKEWFESFNPTQVESPERRENLAMRAIAAARFENLGEIEKVAEIWPGAMLWPVKAMETSALAELSRAPGSFAFEAGQAWARFGGGSAVSERKELMEILGRYFSAPRSMRAGPLAFACGAASQTGFAELMVDIQTMGARSMPVEFGIAEWELWGSPRCARMEPGVRDQFPEREGLSNLGACQSLCLAWSDGLGAGLALSTLVDRDAGAPRPGWLHDALGMIFELVKHDVKGRSALVVDGLNANGRQDFERELASEPKP